MLTLFVRSVILFVAAVIAMRIMGKREVGQLQPYELVVMIMIAELAATPIGDVGSPLLYGILPMAALVVCHGVISFMCMVSQRFRTLMCGRPTILIRDGVICEKALKEMSISLSDLMEDIRIGGMTNPADVAMAILETGGQVTVFPKAESRPVTPKDMDLHPSREALPLTLILDGKVQANNLPLAGLSADWLDGQLKAQGYRRPADVLLMCVTANSVLITQGRGRTTMTRTNVNLPGKAEW